MTRIASGNAVRRLEDRDCATCGTTFRPKTSTRRFCSDPCSRAFPRHASVEQLFWQRVDTSAGLNGCWPWTGIGRPDGYGRLEAIVDGHRVNLRASRVSLELALGRPLADGMYACHTCDNPPCVNPAHLYEGSPTRNMRDAVERGRIAIGERHGSVRLTEGAVVEIRARVAAGAQQRAVAPEYGVSEGTINDLVARRTWAHVA